MLDRRGQANEDFFSTWISVKLFCRRKIRPPAASVTVIPNADQLEVIAQMSRGSLAEIPFAVLLHALAVARRTAVLEIQRRQIKKEIFLEDGMPVECNSNLLHETLGKFMVGRGDITEEQCQLYLSKAATSGQTVADVLIAEGAVTASELFKILQQNLAKKLLDGFTWVSGDFRVLPEMPDVDSPLKVKTPQLIVTGATKLVPDEEIEKSLQPLLDKKLTVNPKPPYPPTELRLSGEHRLVIDLLSDGDYINNLESQRGIPREKLLRLLYSLTVVGIVVPEDWFPPEPMVASPDVDFMLPLPETVEPPDVEITLVHPEEARNQVMEAYLQYRKQDAFDLLDASENASVEAIEQKYVEYCERFAPWKFNQPGLSDLSDKARDLFMAGARAFAELYDSQRRSSLIAQRRSLLTTQTVELNRDQFLIKSELLDSETQFKKGKKLMEAKRYKDAIEQLQFAHDYDPQNSLYRAELAYCLYLNEPGIRAQDSLQALNETLRIDQDCGLAAYYSGVIHQDMGNQIEAEAYLQRSIKMMVPDRRPIEALKALKSGK
jgi:hypothetical protein